MNRFNLLLILLLPLFLSACSGGGGGGGSGGGSNTGGGGGDTSGGGGDTAPPVTRDFSIVLDRIDITRTSNGVSDAPINSGGVVSGDLIYQE